LSLGFFMAVRKDALGSWIARCEAVH
jgi:hypothetical protein